MFDERRAGGQRYWESDVELDLVAPAPADREQLTVAEVKWRRLTVAERKHVFRQLESKWSHCSLRARHPKVFLDVRDASVLGAGKPARRSRSGVAWGDRRAV